MQQKGSKKSKESELKEWLKRCATVTEWPLTTLAKAAGLAPSTVTRFASGKTETVLSNVTVEKIEAVVERRIEERARSGELNAEEALRYLGMRSNTTTELVRVAVIDPRLRAESVSNYMDFPEAWFRSSFGANPSDCVVLAVEGRSFDKELPQGSHLVIDTTIKSGHRVGFYVIEDGFERIPARIGPAKKAGQVLLDIGSDAPTETPAADIKVVGRVVGTWGRM